MEALKLIPSSYLPNSGHFRHHVTTPSFPVPYCPLPICHTHQSGREGRRGQREGGGRNWGLSHKPFGGYVSYNLSGFLPFRREFPFQVIILSFNKAIICLSITLKESKSIILIYRNNELRGQDFIPEWDNNAILKPSPGGFPGGAVVENQPANAGDTGSNPGLGRSHMPRSN